jgi:hypothetical protein
VVPDAASVSPEVAEIAIGVSWMRVFRRSAVTTISPSAPEEGALASVLGDSAGGGGASCAAARLGVTAMTLPRRSARKPAWRRAAPLRPIIDISPILLRWLRLLALHPATFMRRLALRRPKVFRFSGAITELLHL